MKDKLEKEYQKFADLEFEYNIICKFSDDKVEKTVALSKLKKQLAKIEKMEREVVEKPCGEQKPKDE